MTGEAADFGAADMPAGVEDKLFLAACIEWTTLGRAVAANGLEKLERDVRARGRRTRHAEARHASGERPTRKAVDDARVMRGEQCYVDERSGTLVVLGERGRTHFFTAAGQHVSSVRYSKDAIARKLKLEVWREASEDERAALLETLR